MTIATRVLETILPIELVPAGDGRSRARFEKMKYPTRGAQRRTSDSRHSRAQLRSAAMRLVAGPEHAAGPPSHGAQCAHALIKLI